MDIRDSPIWNEVNKIITRGANSAVQYWTATLLINGRVHKPLAVTEIIFDRQYGKRYSDMTKVVLAVAPSTYINYMLPNKTNLQITLIRNPRSEMGGDSERAIYAETFRVILDNTTDPLLTPSINLPSEDDVLDLNDMMFIEMQVATAATEQLRLFMPSGIYHGQVPGNLLRLLFNKFSRLVQTDASRQVTAVDMIDPDNTSVRATIDIADGVMLDELPDLFQNEHGGIYNAGIDFYLQTGCWYIWPRYGLGRNNGTRPVLTVYLLPANALPGSERTYFNGGNQVSVISTSGSVAADPTEVMELNQGNGIRYAGMEDLLGDGFVVEDNKLIGRRAKNVNEYSGGSRGTGLNLARFTGDRITDNPYKQASLLAANKGYTMQISWESADPNLLVPGMETKLFIQRGSELIEKRALLIGANYFVQPRTKKLIAQSHICTGTLTLFVERVDRKRIDLRA